MAWQWQYKNILTEVIQWQDKTELGHVSCVKAKNTGVNFPTAVFLILNLILNFSLVHPLLELNLKMFTPNSPSLSPQHHHKCMKFLLSTVKSCCKMRTFAIHLDLKCVVGLLVLCRSPTAIGQLGCIDDVLALPLSCLAWEHNGSHVPLCHSSSSDNFAVPPYPERGKCCIFMLYGARFLLKTLRNIRENSLNFFNHK